MICKNYFYLYLLLGLFIAGSCKVENTSPETPAAKVTAEKANPNIKTKLQHHFRKSQNNAVSDPLLILLHGLGSNEGDMANLGKNLNPNYHITSLRAPISQAEGKNSWYRYNAKKNTPESNRQMDAAAKDIVMSIKQIKKKYNINPNKVIIGGFSQGGIMSYHTAIMHPSLFSGVIPMSGRMTDYTKGMISQAKDYSDLHFHITHGTEDRRILYTDGQKGFHTLKSRSMKATFFAFNGGHNIAKACYESINEKLGEWVE